VTGGQTLISFSLCIPPYEMAIEPIEGGEGSSETNTIRRHSIPENRADLSAFDSFDQSKAERSGTAA
jgi:hypothetical protein